MAPVKKCFVGLETALYLLFLALDAFSAGGDGVKYLTIVVCLLAAVWSARHGGSRLMAWAMAFTLAADTFLLLLDRWYGMGIVLFCVVQGLYLARIRRACGRTLWALRAGLAAAWVLLNALGMGTALNLLAALYFVNFLVNACQSLTLRSERLFAAGLWLFLLCDVCVGCGTSRRCCRVLPGRRRWGCGCSICRGRCCWCCPAFRSEGGIRHEGSEKAVVMAGHPLYRSGGAHRLHPAGAAGAGLLYGADRPSGDLRGQRPHPPAGGGGLRRRHGLLHGSQTGFFRRVLPFSAEGASHFADVRGLFLLAVWVFVAAAGLLLTGAVVCRLRRQRLPRLGGRTPGFWAACGLGGLFLLIALLAALNFDRAFTVFHSIFFPGKDNWLFDPVADPVILILPEAFFRNCAIAIVTVLLTVCIVLVVTGRKRPSRRSAPGEGTAS